MFPTLGVGDILSSSRKTLLICAYNLCFPVTMLCFSKIQRERETDERGWGGGKTETSKAVNPTIPMLVSDPVALLAYRQIVE